MRLLSILCALACLGGCAPPAKRQDLVQEVLQADPEFGSVLEKHKELQNRIQTFERELALKRTNVEQAIGQLRRDLAAAAVNVKQKTDEAKKRMEPDRLRLNQALTEASDHLQTLRQQRAALGQTMTQRRKTLKSPNSVWTEEERAQQQMQIEEMVREAKRFDQELAALKEHVRLLKIKLLLIKL